MSDIQVQLDWKTIISIISSVVVIGGSIVGYAIAADSRYVDSDELRTIQMQIETNRINDKIEYYQEKILQINDIKDLQGSISSLDRRTKERYEFKIQDLHQELYRINTTQ